MLDLNTIKSYEPRISSAGLINDISDSVSNVKIRYVTYNDMTGSVVKTEDFIKVRDELIELRKKVKK